MIYGAGITIPCTVNGRPSPFRVTWYYTYRNTNVSVVNISDTTKYSGGTLKIPSLTVLNSNDQDAGVYKCEAENQVNSTQRSDTQLFVIEGKMT